MGSSGVGYALWFASLPTQSESLLSPLKRRRRGGARAELEEIRVCTNRTCRKQGSLQILEILTAISPLNVAVKSCGCLGRCGSGPNLALLPDAVLVSHCGTAAVAAQVIYAAAANSCGDDDDDAIRRTLDALAMIKRAHAEIDQANFSEAELLLSQAIELEPFGGLHVIYRYRSLARLGAGNHAGALEDAREALKLAPNYPEAYICEGDAFMAMKDYDAAQKSYTRCLEINPSIRRSRSFKTRVAKLQEKYSVDVPSNQR